MTVFVKRSLFVFCIGLISMQLSAQTSTSASAPAASASASADFPLGVESLTLAAGYSPDSNYGIGKMRDRRLFQIQGRAAWILWTLGGTTLRYYAELTPVAVITQPAENYQLKDGTWRHVADAKTNFGAGFSPIGLQFNFRRSKKTQPFIESNMGFLYFNRQTPVVDSQQMNFTFCFGAGLQIYKNTKGSWMAGYKYHHISNADSGVRNPGVDSNFLWVGYSWGRRR